MVCQDPASTSHQTLPTRRLGDRHAGKRVRYHQEKPHPCEIGQNSGHLRDVATIPKIHFVTDRTLPHGEGL